MGKPSRASRRRLARYNRWSARTDQSRARAGLVPSASGVGRMNQPGVSGGGPTESGRAPPGGPTAGRREEPCWYQISSTSTMFHYMAIVQQGPTNFGALSKILKLAISLKSITNLQP
jgi:hypothetical protein